MSKNKSGKLEMLKLEDLHPSMDNERQRDAVYADSGFVESIKKYGVLQPLVVRKVDFGYEIIAGHRRAEAAGLAGLEEVPCMVRESKGDVTMLRLVENMHREDLDPYEIALGVVNALESGVKGKDLAAELDMAESTVSRYKTIAKAYLLHMSRVDEDGTHPTMQHPTTGKYLAWHVLTGSRFEEAYNAASDWMTPAEKVKKVSASKAAKPEQKEKQEQLIPKTLEEIIKEHLQDCGGELVKFSQDKEGNSVGVQFFFATKEQANEFFEFLG